MESMLALREKGIDSLFSTLDSILPPLVASGLASDQAIMLSNGNFTLSLLSVYLSCFEAPCAAFRVTFNDYSSQVSLSVVLCSLLYRAYSLWAMQFLYDHKV